MELFVVKTHEENMTAYSKSDVIGIFTDGESARNCAFAYIRGIRDKLIEEWGEERVRCDIKDIDNMHIVLNANTGDDEIYYEVQVLEKKLDNKEN